jgi:hypothetical protein
MVTIRGFGNGRADSAINRLLPLLVEKACDRVPGLARSPALEVTVS